MASIIALGGAAFYLLKYMDKEQKAEPVQDVTIDDNFIASRLVRDANIINPRPESGHIEPHRTYWWDSGDTIYEPHISEGRWIRRSFKDRKRWDTERNRYHMNNMSYHPEGEQWALGTNQFPHNYL